MKEVDPLNGWENEGGFTCPTKCVEENHPGKEHEEWVSEAITGPSETEKIIVTMLMRLYDVQMAILTAMDEETAGKIFDAHNVGAHFNPEIYVPEFTTND